MSVHMVRSLIFGFVFLFGFWQSGQAEILSVCQLVSEPKRFSGKRVTVMGRVVRHRHGETLSDPSDQDCDRIAFGLPSAVGSSPSARFTVIEDWNYQDMTKAVHHAWVPPPGSPGGVRVLAVLQGKFDTRYRIVNGDRVLSRWRLGNLIGRRYFNGFELNRVIRVERVSSQEWRQRRGTIAAAMLKTVIEPTTRYRDGWPELYLAAMENDDPSVIIDLVKDGADPNARGRNGRSPLHLAAGFSDHPAIIEALVRAGADPMAQTENGWTALHFAADLNGNPEVSAALVKAGSDAKTASAAGDLTPLHVAAANNPNPSVVGVLLEAGADPKALSENGFTPLDLAALENGNPEFINTLVEAGADRRVLSASHHGPLDLAVSNNNPAVVTALVRAGSELRTRFGIRGDSFGGTGLLSLAFTVDAHIEMATIAGLVDPGADETPQTIMAYGAVPHLCVAAVWNGNPGVIRTLVEAGADPSVRSENGFTPLHFAAASNYSPGVIRTLVEAGADPSVRSENGFTPLHFAVASNYGGGVPIIRALRDVGADPAIRNDAGKLPWEYVEEDSIPEDTDIYRWLKEASLIEVVE